MGTVLSAPETSAVAPATEASTSRMPVSSLGSFQDGFFRRAAGADGSGAELIRVPLAGIRPVEGQPPMVLHSVPPYGCGCLHSYAPPRKINQQPVQHVHKRPRLSTTAT